jgi:intracellular septation protein A
MPDAPGSSSEPIDSAAAAALEGAQHVSVKSLMLGTGPRFARDAFGPILVFYVGWKLFGLGIGIGAATVMSVLSWRYEKRRDRSARMALFSLGFVLFQAAVGLVSGSATVYLAQPVLLSGGFGLAFIVSVAVKRPLAGMFAEELYPFPPEVKESVTFLRIFSRISLVWGVYQLLRSGLRLLVLIVGEVEAFLLVNLVTGVPLVAGLMSWSIWSALRGFRRSEEWGWALRGEDPPAEVVARYLEELEEPPLPPQAAPEA